MRDPISPLTVLAESLEADLQNQTTSLMLSLHRGLLTLAYHQVVFLHWRMVGRDLICEPKGWRRKTYTAPGPLKARDITIHLVFEFVQQFGMPIKPPASLGDSRRSITDERVELVFWPLLRSGEIG